MVVAIIDGDAVPSAPDPELMASAGGGGFAGRRAGMDREISSKKAVRLAAFPCMAEWG